MEYNHFDEICSLAATEVVKRADSHAASDDNFVKMMLFFQLSVYGYVHNATNLNIFNTLRLRQNEWPSLADNTSKCIFLNEIFLPLIEISLKYVP